jgi:hypothetical protein
MEAFPLPREAVSDLVRMAKLHNKKVGDVPTPR